MKTFQYDMLSAKIYKDRTEMGRSAAAEAGEYLRRLLKIQEEVRCVFAAAPSQNEFLAGLVEQPGIEWERVVAFHMDEYLGLPSEDARSFSSFLKAAIFDKLPFRAVHLINGTASADEECERYTMLLKEKPIDIVFMGIGENGHIAFNDPHVADFHDPLAMKCVVLDDICRMQQVHDGCFESLDAVPTQALTLTVPTLTSARQIFCIVPGRNKARAVKSCLKECVAESCPASILRQTPKAVLYLDEESAVFL